MHSLESMNDVKYASYMTGETKPRQGFTFHPSSDVRVRLEELSRQTNRPVSFYINALLEEHLAEIEHAFALKADAEAAQSGKLKTYNLAEARAELGL